MRRIFDELDYRMSVVKRWGVIQTIRTQSDAEHCFNVARICARIIDRWNQETPISCGVDVGEMLAAALHHDDDEAITGDFPSYMKNWVDVAGALGTVPAWENEKVTFPKSGDEHYILKAADYIDACVFLRMEVSLGNRTVTYHLQKLEARFSNFCREWMLGDGGSPNLYEWYKEDVVDRLFGSSGQYVSEIDGFPKTT